MQSGWVLKVRIPVVCEGAGWQQAAAPLPGGIPQASWTGAELQPADVAGDSEVSDLCLERLHNQMFHIKYDVMFLRGRSHQFKLLHARNSILLGFMSKICIGKCRGPHVFVFQDSPGLGLPRRPCRWTRRRQSQEHEAVCNVRPPKYHYCIGINQAAQRHRQTFIQSDTSAH